MIYFNENGSHSNFPSPERFYAQSLRQGKHKIFLGMAPGVGKTYRMLEEAHQLKREGVDVVIGLLETHGRKETAEKAAGLEVVSQKEIVCGGMALTEMDTDAILARSPQLVLVDELAHTNVPGCQREKRYQDVEAILAAGIDVFSTVNIQHLESLNHLVAKITGVMERDRIPDRLLDETDKTSDVVVVDVTPEMLQERLLEGKIYEPEKIEQSLQNFFQRRNLIALRDLALREIADNIEEAAVTLTPTRRYCSVHERVLVCVSACPDSLQLMRRGVQLVTQMHARFYALFVNHPERFLTQDESLYIETCEHFCREFGGEFLRVTSADISKTIAEVAQKYHITQVFIGQCQQSRWGSFWQDSSVHRLIRCLKNVDLHVIATDKTPFK